MRHRLLKTILLSILAYQSSYAFRILDVTPSSHSLTADKNTEITFTFDQPVNIASINPGSVSVFGHWSGVAIGAFTLEDDQTTVRFTPSTVFNSGEWVCVSISKSALSLNAEQLTTGYTWTFWIKPSPGNIELVETDRISTRQPGEGHIQTYGAHGGDLNHDGFSDFFVPNEISNDCRVFINDGTGGYADFTIYPIPNGARPSTNESADFNKDGHLDIAVGNSTGDSITVFLGDGNGIFYSVKNYQAADGIRGLAVSDMNGDGYPDIVTANRSGNNMSILHNNGDGTFVPRILLDGNGTGETACATADANADGILDVFVGSHGSGEIGLLLGDGAGGFSFSEKVSAGGGGTWMIAVGDMNGDGHVDVAGVNSQSSNVGVIFGDGAGGLSAATTYPTGGFPIAIDLGDIDGDEDLDLMTSNYSGGNWTYWENDGTGTFINRRTLNADDAGSCATFHDRDNDGDLDMTGIDEESDLVFLFENTGISSVGDVEAENTIRVYPNPSQSGWLVELDSPDCFQVRLLDMSGIELLRMNCGDQHRIFISTSQFITGTYMLKFIDADQKVISTHTVNLIR